MRLIRIKGSRRYGIASSRRYCGLTILGVGVSLIALAGYSATDEASAQASNPGTALIAQATPPQASAESQTAEAPVPQGSVDVAALMEEGPLPDVVIGDPDAPVTIIEYASMTCPHCASFHENTLPTIMEDYIETGQAKLIVREFPFDPRSLAAFMLARCAPNENRTEMIDVLFDQQAEWARAENASEALLQIARMAGFTQESFAACLNDTELQENIIEIQQRAASEFGVEATPTFFVNGDKYAGALPPEQMAAVIEAHL